MKDKLAISKTLKGKIIITSADTGEILYQKNNAIQPYATTVLLNMLANNTGYAPNSINIWLAGVNIASGPITAYTIDLSGSTITYLAFFDAPSFSGPLDETTLECLGGRFSQATGLSFTKDPAQAIYVSWQIKVM